MTKLPDVTLTAIGGGEVSTTGIGPAVLFFFPKADTPGCTSEAKDFSALKGEFDALGIRVIGLSKDPAAKLAKFEVKHALTVELLSDETGDLSEQLGVWKEKSLYGRKFMGIERSTFLLGKDGEIVREWRKVKVAGHADAVLAAARELA